MFELLADFARDAQWIMPFGLSIIVADRRVASSAVDAARAVAKYSPAAASRTAIVTSCAVTARPALERVQQRYRMSICRRVAGRTPDSPVLPEQLSRNGQARGMRQREAARETAPAHDQSSFYLCDRVRLRGACGGGMFCGNRPPRDLRRQ